MAAGLPIVYLTALYGSPTSGFAARSARPRALGGGRGRHGRDPPGAAAGAEVYGTAAPGKWDALRANGFDDDHLADSRNPRLRGQVPPASSTSSSRR